MPLRNDGVICRECGGSGCPNCNHSGYSYMNRQEAPKFADIPSVPMPYGKILPDLTDCTYPNDPWPSYLEPILCPNCGSDHVVGLSKKHNPFIEDEQGVLSNRWFCISCQDSWCYERER